MRAEIIDFLFRFCDVYLKTRTRIAPAFGFICSACTQIFGSSGLGFFILRNKSVKTNRTGVHEPGLSNHLYCSLKKKEIKHRQWGRDNFTRQHWTCHSIASWSTGNPNSKISECKRTIWAQAEQVSWGYLSVSTGFWAKASRNKVKCCPQTEIPRSGIKSKCWRRPIRRHTPVWCFSRAQAFCCVEFKQRRPALGRGTHPCGQRNAMFCIQIQWYAEFKV